VNDLLVDEAFDAVFGHTGVPESFGIDHEDGSTFADSQAVDFGSIACVRSGGEGQFPFFEEVFQFGPGGASLLSRAAGFADAQEDVAGVFPDLEILGDGGQL